MNPTFACLQLIRFDKPAGTLLLMWPPLWCLVLLSEGVPPLDLLVAFALGAFFMRSAGCIINDMTDQKLDAQVERTKNRPLASGALSMKQAVVMLALMLLGALSVAAYLGLDVIVAALPAVPLVAAYPWMKRITFWPQLFLGITFNYGVLLASIALIGSIQPDAWILYAACIFWTLGYDTIYGFQDIEDDKKIGIKSTSRLFATKPKLAVGIMYLLSAACVFMVSHVLAVVMALSFVWQIITLDAKSANSCAKLFKHNANMLGPVALGMSMITLYI